MANNWSAMYYYTLSSCVLRLWYTVIWKIFSVEFFSVCAIIDEINFFQQWIIRTMKNCNRTSNRWTSSRLSMIHSRASDLCGSTCLWEAIWSLEMEDDPWLVQTSLLLQHICHCQPVIWVCCLSGNSTLHLNKFRLITKTKLITQK